MTLHTYGAVVIHNLSVTLKSAFFSLVSDLLQGMGPYSVSKTALLGLTKVLAKELGGDNITVNCLAPGIVRTKMSSYVSFLLPHLQGFSQP